ncbi:hypothetical protein N658DRAFT_466705 [Parathielavia hyrcaniae]|uniref:HTH CENPB-type domain-containing protein n=1 Tax=Parathielavia hyrcaniae TaxID=113614 RepID=A0AAN6Q9P6_9PEZI|nr:hypothetical protein N658DRAFT_466705 [Parathielavia hyrcaniae]
MAYTEADLIDAVAAAMEKRREICAIARQFGVPVSTLQHRLKGVQNNRAAAVNLQKIPQTQEDKLAEWVVTQRALGVPATRAQIIEFAKRIIAEQGGTEKVGSPWFRRFLARHPALKPQWTKPMESTRIDGATGVPDSAALIPTPGKRAEPRSTPGKLDIDLTEKATRRRLFRKIKRGHG